MASPTGTFRPADRLLRSADFERVLRRGNRVAAGEFVLIAAAGEGERCRLGLTVGKRVGNSVRRNAVKRRVREWFRANRGKLPAGTDLVVVGRSGAARLSGREVFARLDAAVARQARS